MKTDRSERPGVSNVVRRDEIDVESVHVKGHQCSVHVQGHQCSVHVQGHQCSCQGYQCRRCATNVNADV